MMKTPELPYITPEFSGVGGHIKNQPQDFIVQEIPLYETSGVGEHLYVNFTREGYTTRELQSKIARILKLKEFQIGMAGLKDKNARVTQTFSIHMPSARDAEVKQKIEDAVDVQVNWLKRHGNKLKTGHLLGNRFSIIIRDHSQNAIDDVQGIRKRILEKGLPNFYGEQRFGMAGDNFQKGKDVLAGKGPRDKWFKKFFLSAFQSSLFNTWLTQRIKNKIFEQLLVGDIAKRVDSGGLFLVEDLSAEMKRFSEDSITYTGPIYGYKMTWPKGIPGDIEHAIFKETGLEIEQLKPFRLKGSRRIARVILDEIKINFGPDHIELSFSLPKGVYATILLREFMKSG